MSLIVSGEVVCDGKGCLATMKIRFRYDNEYGIHLSPINKDYNDWYHSYDHHYCPQCAEKVKP